MKLIGEKQAIFDELPESDGVCCEFFKIKNTSQHPKKTPLKQQKVKRFEVVAATTTLGPGRPVVKSQQLDHVGEQVEVVNLKRELSEQGNSIEDDKYSWPLLTCAWVPAWVWGYLMVFVAYLKSV